MPLHEFTCKGCGTRFEDLIRSDRDVPTCPSCGGTAVVRHLSVFATSTGANSPCDLGACDVPGGESVCRGGVCPHQL
jgi:putative FmdB family regulatory protein